MQSMHHAFIRILLYIILEILSIFFQKVLKEKGRTLKFFVAYRDLPTKKGRRAFKLFVLFLLGH